MLRPRIWQLKVADEEVAAVDSTDITVSGDGIGKTRGHTSQIGVCTVIGADTGKVIDVEVLSKACKGCSRWKGPRLGSASKKWHARHSQICPKISGSGRRIAEIAVYESVVRFNEGRLGRLDIMKELELRISHNAISSHNEADIRRIKQGDRRAKQNIIEIRRERRRAKALVESKFTKKEGLAYEAGGF
ncbi:hypothetical protein AVEN_140213-1 [Araneus ventricosus]|uniref:Mutator-like transposase domain-containing protein n=1 Tax=Araneus ventricosus TaxID=182803 RepID=A0A4Y2I7C0_ARAVE|nr:hypothetical protein AVEN_140213-1 [Araneus ventricosus]